MLDIKVLLTKILTSLDSQSGQGGQAGMIEIFAGSTAPTGWLMCDGSAVSRTDYATLFSVIGTTYGTGDGSTTFNLPDMRGRFPLGSNSTYSLNATGGATTVTLTAAQSGMRAHTHSMAHTHPTNTSGENFLTIDTSVANAQFQINSSGNKYTIGLAGMNHFHARSATGASSAANTGAVNTISGASATSAHENMPPYIGVNYIIATGVTS